MQNHNLPFEVRTIGPYNHEVNSSNWFSLSTEIISAQQNAYESEGPGLPQFVIMPNGVSMHWLSGTDLEYAHILNIFPVYPSAEKAKCLWDTFKAVS